MTPVVLSPPAVRAAYELLASQPPFSRWTLPPADAVRFVVTAHADRHGDYATGVLRVSRKGVATLGALLETVAHEMCHAVDEIEGTETRGVEHGAAFRRRWRAVCRRHGFDYLRSLPAGTRV